jgi:hypothetical protein
VMLGKGASAESPFPGVPVKPKGAT